MLLAITEGERHIILYAKLYYEWHGFAQDMSVIVGEPYGIDCLQISTHAIYGYVIDLYDKLHLAGFIRLSMSDFVRDLFDKHDHTVNYQDVMKKMIITIQGIEVELDSGLSIEIGEPNEKLLPLSKKING
jgi:hypothetical protein